MVVAVAIQVVSRNLNIPISRAGEIAVICQAWMVLLGAGLAMRYGQHVGIDVLIKKCPPRLQQIITIGAVLLCLWFLGVMFIAGLELMEIAKFQTTSTGLPMPLSYAALPVGSAYFALELIVGMWPLMRLGGRVQEEHQA
jgi:TRAP-type C4-dicarboxylate transport system permease small subunit